MSSSERQRWLRRVKTLCAACQERKAGFRYRGEVRADRDHTLCFECHRGEVNRARARRLTEFATPLHTQLTPARFGTLNSRVLTDQQIAHRQQMLDHLRTASAIAS